MRKHTRISYIAEGCYYLIEFFLDNGKLDIVDTARTWTEAFYLAREWEHA